MTGDYRSVFGAQMAFGCAVIWGFSIINIPVGIVGCGYKFCRGLCAEDAEESTRNMRFSGAFLISAIPIVGPILAIKYLKG